MRAKQIVAWKRVLVGAAILWMGGAGAVSALPSRGADDIRRAVFSAGTLWVVSEDGTVRTVSASGQTQAVAVPGETLDICASAGRVWTVSQPGADEHQLVLKQMGAASEGFRFQSPDFVALSCDAGAVRVVDRNAVFTLTPAGLKTGALSAPIGYGDMSVLSVGTTLYVGANRGEFGGGLQVVDLPTGRVTQIDTATPQSVCDGLLARKCDAVTGLVASPFHAGCAIATLGVDHFFSTGRILEVCGTRLRLVYRQTLDDHGRPAPPPKKSQMMTRETPFFGVTVAGGKLIAVAKTDVLTIAQGKAPAFSKIPAMTRAGPFWLHDAGGYILLVTTADAKHSLGGAHAILVPKG